MLPDDAPPGATYLVFTTADSRRRGLATLARYRAIPSEPLATIGSSTHGAEITLAMP